MNNIFITLKKELKSFFRDKKTLATLFIYPILIPAMIILYGVIYESIESEDQSFSVGFAYQLNESEAAIAEEMKIDYKDNKSEEEIKTMFENNEIDAYVTYDEAAQKYYVYASSKSTNGMMAAEMSDAFLEAYDKVLTNQYLVEKGIDLEEAYNHFTVEDVDLSENNYAVNIVLGICFTYVILAIAISCSNVAVSSTALEKENGTLETILTFPITTRELITGKYLASVVLGFVASLCSIVFLVGGLAYGKATYAIYNDFTFILNAKTILCGIVVSLISAFFIAGVAFFLTAKTKSFKEAQSKISFITTVCIIPMFVGLMNVPIDAKYYLIPICNSVQILNDMFTNSLDLVNLLICMVSNVLYGMIIIYLVSKTYKSEKVLFSN